MSEATPNPHTNLTTSIDGFKADLEENGATVRITNRHEMFCEEHYQGRSTPYLRPVTIFALFWRRFGVEHVVVYVRVASLFAQAELKESQ